MAKCALHNLGCKVNSYETQAMQQMLEAAGYTIVPFGEEKADVYIINTCSVTNIADQKSRQMIHKARRLNPEAVIVAAGCYAESGKNLSDDHIDLILGNNEKSRLPELLNGYFADPEQTINTAGRIQQAVSYDEMKIDRPSEHTRAFVKIQDGCNRFCAYCIIPYVRGRIRSRPPREVLAEICRLALNGCKEVVLTGIHLSSYGVDGPQNGISLIGLIEQIEQIDGIRRIRLGSLEPKIVTDEFAARLAACKKVCPHFHLSLQSGCDSVLSRMNRKYTVAEYENGVCILRKYFSNPAITTDVIVGFPGETEAEFETTRQFLEKIRFYELHVFKFSRRKGTAADRMPDQINGRIKNERSDILLRMDERLSGEYRKTYLGRTVSVLLEEEKEIDGVRCMTGFTDTYVKTAVFVGKNGFAPNRFVNVKVEKLYGKDMVIGVAEN